MAKGSIATARGNGDGRQGRGASRRQEILDAAVELFNERGYHDTGMNDIGAAVGITGPGIYRHFPSKQSILETALLQAGEAMYSRVIEIVEGDLPPDRLLQALVDNYIDALTELPALSHVVMAERRILSDEVRAWINRRLRLHAEEWVHALLRVRPELSELEARVMVTGVSGLSHVIDRRWAGIERERLAAMLKDIARAALFADYLFQDQRPLANLD